MFARRTTLSIGYIPCCVVVLMQHNVKNMKCTGLKAVSYPNTRHLIKGSTVKHAITPVYFIFGVMQSTFLLWNNTISKQQEH